ncbi:hypothetical protein WJX72_001601 [[Myrmecia] bisecta]|uniref:TPM domain-containing protein n=1 Tax=[Myrmecia] bisecta TaxID=41462 RepID=A0AAW1PCG5_9CHLO
MASTVQSALPASRVLLASAFTVCVRALGVSHRQRKGMPLMARWSHDRSSYRRTRLSNPSLTSWQARPPLPLLQRSMRCGRSQGVIIIIIIKRFHYRPKKIISGLGWTAPPNSRKQAICRAQQKEGGFTEVLGTKLAAAAAAAVLSVSSLSGAALANEFDLLSEPVPTNNYLIDDANVLNKTTKKGVNTALARLEAETGYRLEVATVRKLEFENDAFAFGDKIIEKWYPTVEQGDKKGLLVIVTSGKDGALTGGPSFMKAVGDRLVDSIISDNIPILTEAEKFNEAVTSCVKRIEAALQGKSDPGAPQRNEQVRQRTFKTKEETNKTRTVTATIVGTLLVISFVVPMLQYFGYTSKE